MAYIPKSKRGVEAVAAPPSNADVALKGIFSDLDKMNEDATLLSDDNTLSIVNDWIDTGCLALNAIISGSLYKGIPSGRLTGLSGPSQAGKTLIINKTIAQAQKKGYFAAIWDTEAAVDKQSAINVGMDPKRTKYYPVETIESCRNQIVTFLDKIIAAKDPSIKVIIAIDSLGNLSSQKELNDIAAGKDAMDMGMRAKALKSLMRTLTFKAAKARVPIIFSNHIYDNPGAMHPELVKTQAGGKGPVYIASVLVQLGIRNEKIANNEDEVSIGLAHSVSGATLSALTVKNRFVPPYLKAELYNNFSTGLDKYAGLFDMLVSMKVIEQTGSTYSFQGEKLGYAKTWSGDTELWETKLLPALEEALNKSLRYNDMTAVDAALDDDVEEIEDDTSQQA